MPLKQIKFILEFTFDFEDITDEIVKEKISDRENYDELVNNSDFWEHAHRQKRLLHALTTDRELLKKYTTQLLPEFLEMEGRDLVEDFLLSSGDGTESDRILDTVIKKLPSKDREFFEEVEEENMFSENANLFFEAFDFKLLDVTITEE